VIYLDTSYIVKAYIREPGSDLVLSELEGQSGLTASRLAKVEFVSALMRQRKAGDISKAAAGSAIHSLEKDSAIGIWTWIDISGSILSASTALLTHRSHFGKLRSLDAIHLATAKNLGTERLYTHDQRMFEAAEHFGLNPIDVIP